MLKASPRHAWLSRRRGITIHFCGLQRLAWMIGRVVGQVFVVYLGLRQQQLMFRREWQIMRDVLVFEHLLRDAMKHGC